MARTKNHSLEKLYVENETFLKARKQAGTQFFKTKEQC